MQFWNLKIKMRIFGIQMEISKLLVKLIYVLQHISWDVAQKVASQSEKLWARCMFWSELFLSSTEWWLWNTFGGKINYFKSTFEPLQRGKVQWFFSRYTYFRGFSIRQFMEGCLSVFHKGFTRWFKSPWPALKPHECSSIY